MPKRTHGCWMMSPAGALVVLFLIAASAHAADPARGITFFEMKVRPVLAKHCYACHSTKQPKGGLRLDSIAGIRAGGESGLAVEPGDAKASLLIQAIRRDGLAMPPKNKLPADAVADLVAWVQMGAPLPSLTTTEHQAVDAKSHWSFQPPRTIEQPSVNDKAWPRSDIDRFVLARLESEKLQPVGDAEPRVLIRRLYFDLIGLPPDPQEMDRWTSRLEGSADRRHSGVAELVDYLLASQHFGERWARHWLDLARFAETNGNADNTPFPHAWRYRDYVIASLNEDKPYDCFVREQIAGDLLPAESAEQRDELLVATGFLALASKPRAQNNPDYEMDLVADQIDVTTRAVLGLTVLCARCHDHKFDPIPTREYYALAGIFKSSWLMAGGSTETGGKKREPLAGDGLHDLSDRSQAMGVREGDPLDCQVCLGGDSEQLGESVPRGFFTATPGTPREIDPSHSGRLELAAWLTSADNPLTARVAVNRVWHHLFGHGLVATPDDFGVLGGVPSHPELLDWLAVRFVDEGWSTKRLIRAIVLSRVYHLASTHDATNYEHDAENVLLWRMNFRRLDAESIRDAMLVASGQLDRNPPGRSMLPDPPNKGWQRRIEHSRHRSVYQAVLRDLPMREILTVFDVADPNLIIARRDATNVPTQALSLTSGEFAVTQSELMAARLLEGEGESMTDAERVDWVYRLAYSRSPTDEQRDGALSYLTEYTKISPSKDPKQATFKAWSSLCKSLMASAEFRFIE